MVVVNGRWTFAIASQRPLFTIGGLTLASGGLPSVAGQLRVQRL